MTLHLRETGSSSSAGSRQEINHPHHLDRKDMAFLLDKLEETLGQPCGISPGELALLRFSFHQNIADNVSNDKMLANLLPMIRAFIDFTAATNKTDPRGYSQPAYYIYRTCSTRISVHQREMVRVDSNKTQLPVEANEWFFDQAIHISCAAEPSFGIAFKTIIHGADGRPPKSIRHAEFWMNGQMAQSVLDGMTGKRFGEIMDQDSMSHHFIGPALDDWIIAQATNEEDLSTENLTINLKLMQP